jgi:hypothetical protein
MKYVSEKLIIFHFIPTLGLTMICKLVLLLSRSLHTLGSKEVGGHEHMTTSLHFACP